MSPLDLPGQLDESGLEVDRPATPRAVEHHHAGVEDFVGQKVWPNVLGAFVVRNVADLVVVLVILERLLLKVLLGSHVELILRNKAFGVGVSRKEKFGEALIDLSTAVY